MGIRRESGRQDPLKRMRMKIKICLLAVLLASLLPCRLPAQEAGVSQEEAEEDEKEREKERVESVLSFDLGWLIHGLANNGVALGLNYERLVVPHFSLRTTVGAMLLNVSALDACALDFSISLYANWYPLSRMLDKLYVGVGAIADFMYYFLGAGLPSPPMDALISVMPTIGWKQNIANVVVLDFYGGYSFLAFNTQRFHGADDYIRSGVQLGIRFKILWRPGKG